MYSCTSKRLRLILAIFAFIIFSLVLVGVLGQSKVQTLTLLDGTKVQFLGITTGTNHWNPTTPFYIRALSRLPSLAAVVIPQLPKSAGSQPSMAVLSQRGVVLWFYLEKQPLLGQKLVFRCLNNNGEHVAAFGNLESRSETNATPIWVSSLEADEATNIHSIEIYLRDMPLSGALTGIFNPISEMDIYPGFRVGEFRIAESSKSQQ